jgi:predicted neutral ceramidase superfamily lipid hydrolase
MKTFNLPYFAIRWLTLLIYFLPFVFFLSTCTGTITLENTYNKTDAIASEQSKIAYNNREVYSLIQELNSKEQANDTIKSELDRRINQSDTIYNLNQKWEDRLMMPTPYSISGFATVIFYKDMVGRFLIAISLFLSFITLILWRLFIKNNMTLYFIGANAMVVFAFIAYSIAIHVTVLVGAWLLLCLLVIQILTEIQKKITH